MIPTLSLAVAHGPGWGGGLWWLGPIFALFWIGLLITLIILVARRRGRGGPGYWGHGPWAHGAGTRSAEATLAERYANGDIDEKEYRARLEVLRATGPTPPSA